MKEIWLNNITTINLTKELTEEEYKETMGLKMSDVTETAEPVTDIWPYITFLVEENVINKYVLENNLIEKVYRNNNSTFDHILLPTNDEYIFIILIVSLKEQNIIGHYKLDLRKEYY